MGVITWNEGTSCSVSHGTSGTIQFVMYSYLPEDIASDAAEVEDLKYTYMGEVTVELTEILPKLQKNPGEQIALYDLTIASSINPDYLPFDNLEGKLKIGLCAKEL